MLKLKIVFWTRNGHPGGGLELLLGGRLIAYLTVLDSTRHLEYSLKNIKRAE